MWNDYTLTLTVDRLVAGIPANERMLDAWLGARAARMKPVAGAPAGLAQNPEEARTEHAASIATLDPEATHGVIFYRDEDGNPGYEGRCLKAAFKEAANILKDTMGVKNFRSKLAERLFVLDKLAPITTPVYFDERPLTVMTMQGPRTSIKRYEFTEGPTFAFRLRVLADDVVTEERLRTMLEYMAFNGIGSDRSQGQGTLTNWSLTTGHKGRTSKG